MKIGSIILLAVTLLFQRAAFASYAIYVGKNLAADGSVLIGGSGDEVSSHWLEVVPAQDHPKGASMTVGVTADATRFVTRDWQIQEATEAESGLAASAQSAKAHSAAERSRKISRAPTRIWCAVTRPDGQRTSTSARSAPIRLTSCQRLFWLWKASAERTL